MIDFRYHLVSLVAVFIALAVGIALGAGPLREGISSTLESEVADLRTERTDLRAEVDHADQVADGKDTALGLVSERTSAGTLQDVRVGLVVLPGADRNVVDALEGRLVGAGADVVLMAEVDPRWETPNPPADRQQALDELATQVADPEPSTAEGPTEATVLAATLAGADEEGQPGAWLSVAVGLEQQRLVDFTWRDTDPNDVLDRRAPEALVLVPGGLTTAAAQEGTGVETLTRRVELVRALAELRTPLVVAGLGGEARQAEAALEGDPLVRAVREDRALALDVSTVDNLESASGQLAATLALALTYDGEVGHYGLADLAQQPFPPVPPVRTPGIPMPGELDGQGTGVDGTGGDGTGDGSSGVLPGTGDGQGGEPGTGGTPGTDPDGGTNDGPVGGQEATDPGGTDQGAGDAAPTGTSAP